MRTPEVTCNLLGDRLALLVTDQHDLHGTNPSEARDNRRVIAESSVAMQFAEVAAHELEIVT